MFNRKHLKNKLHQLDSSNSVQLWTNDLIPGIIKIFGCHISKGSNYKAVYVSTVSTAKEVVVTALDKYGLEICNPNDYILCDVVGEYLVDQEDQNVKKKKEKVKGRAGDKNEFDDYSPWNTIYIRPLTDSEKPLVIQSLWKAADGKFRRFELRKRIDLETSSFFINTSVAMGRSDSFESLFHYSDSTEEASSNKVVNTNSSHDNSLTSNQIVPSNVPFLLLLTGYDPLDKLVHSLDKRVMTVGPFIEESNEQNDILLHSYNFSKVIASIYKKVRNIEHETNIDEARLDVYIEPKENADITVDGKRIFEETILVAGQLISFGKNYLYIYKDPTETSDSDSPLLWMETLKSAHLEHSSAVHYSNESKEQSVQVDLSDFDLSDKDTSSLKNYPTRNPESSSFVQKSKVRLSYDFQDEDKLIDKIMGIRKEELKSFTTIPAYLFLMSIEHSAANFTEIQTRRFLLKIAGEMQSIAWHKTKGIGKHPSKDVLPFPLLKGLLSELEVVFLWMTNTLEMLHFLQCNLKSYLIPANQIDCKQTAVLYADEELLSVLEEVIMFTFQQTVYHLTKVLYMALPSVLMNDDSVDEEQGSVTLIVEVLAEIFDTVERLFVHPQMISQLFSYLFFFLNASLFNFLIEKKVFQKLFDTNGGTQLKQSVHYIEEWASKKALHNEYIKYMGGYLSVIDILSKSRTELLDTNWTVFRETYPLLKPCQLQFLLSEYQSNTGLDSKDWCPTAEDMEDAYQSNNLLENFASHPPLVLPSSQFDIDLHTSNENVINQLSELIQNFELNVTFAVDNNSNVTI